MSERLRLFVAVDLPAEVRSALAAWCDHAAPEGVRRVPAANLHLTLAFLGSRSSADAAAVAALLPELARDTGELQTAGALWLPPRRPGALAVALRESASLAAQHSEVAAALANVIGFEVPTRPFRPHVTVGRVRRGTRIAACELDPPVLTFAPAALALYRSHTGPGGSRYEPLARVGSPS